VAEPELAVVYSPREWANRVVRHVTDHGGGRVRLRVVDRRVCLEEEFDVLIAEDVTSFLDARLVKELRRRGRQILGVYDPNEPTGKDRLLELGVDDVIEDSAPAEEYVRKIGRILPLTPKSPPPLSSGLRGDLVALEAHDDGPDQTGLPGAGHPVHGLRGRVCAVGGPPGGCGVSEVAVELARAGRRRGATSLLVDADEVAPSLAQRLGLPPVPNIRTAIDALFHGTGRLHDTLLPVARGGFELLAGLANPADWPQVRPQEAAEVVAELRSLRDHVIVNVGAHTEDLARLGAADRYGVTREVLGAADVVVGIGVATPIGVARLVSWIADVVVLAPGKPVHLVVNKVPASRFVRGEVEAEILRNYSPASLHLLPLDAAVEKAAWRGELVAQGPFTRGVDDLADAALAGGSRAVPVPGRRPEPKGALRRRARP
jgi:MinD-like ATPase involved in chromosome partitioning or flagellar assembly